MRPSAVGSAGGRGRPKVLSLIAEGLSNTEIAERQVVTETTVTSHVNHLWAKTGARDCAQVLAYAYRNGLAPEGQGTRTSRLELAPAGYIIEAPRAPRARA